MSALPLESAATASVATRSVENFREWLRHEIGKSSDLGLLNIDFSQSIEQMGMSSVHVVRLTGEIEKLLDLELEPTFLYEFDTIDDLCATVLKMRDGRKAREDTAARRPIPLLVAATFTAEPIEESLRHLLSRLGGEPEVKFARYNQVFQELLNPQSELSSAGSGFGVLLVRIEDWFRYGAEQPSLETVSHTVDDFIHALEGAAARVKVELILALAPHSPIAVRRLGLSEHLTALDRRIIESADAIPGVTLLDLRHVEETFRLSRVWDEARDKLGHIPFTQSCFTAMGVAIARRCAIMLIGPAKVIVSDCDNTLWGGVCGEDGPTGVITDGPYAAFQAFLVAQQRDGKLICLSSKNNEADVTRTFAANPRMPLRLDHITAHRINWDRKSESIRSLAKELDLGLDSFIFIDDNPMECEEVRSALPEVLVVQVPAEPHHIPAFFAHHWAFDTLIVTEEDRRRTEMYRENRERKAMRAETASFDDFLRKLQVVVDIAPVADDEIARAAQLTHRTNQFNARKIVRNEAEIQAVRETAGHHLLRVRVRDRFGDYGLIGLIGGREQGGRLVVDTFLLSCRVLGRAVEHTMVRRIAELAVAHGLGEVAIAFEPSERNAVARTFLQSLGAGIVPVGGTDGCSGEVRFIAAEVDQLLAAAVHQTEAPAAPAPAADPSAGSVVLRVLAADGLAEIAHAGADVDRVEASIDATSRSRRPALATEYVTPRTAWEKKVAAIWRDVLRIDRVGIYDSFFELGGDSLRAAEAFARMWDLGVPESVSLQTVENPTVAGLCRAVEDIKAGLKPTLLADRFSLAEEGRLATDIGHPGYDVATYARPMQRVLLTGGTGYIGAFLIHELFAQVAGVSILCLVRAPTPEDGRQRIIANLRRYELYRPAFAERLDVVLGDLTEPCFGLRPDAFAALADRIDTIFHSAAWVNFVYPYQHLKKTNVDSTETVLRLATAAKPTPIQVHFISTLGVIMSTGYGRGNPVYEKDPLLHADDLLNGYEQTKYASDKMVWTAFKERGIPGAIYRPGLVSGLSSGVYHKLDEFLPQFLKGCIQLGSWPHLETLWEMAPVDFVSKAIVHIARNTANLNQAYFVLHPDSRPFPEFIEWHRQFGYKVRALPWDIWKREFLNLGTERLRKNAMFPFVDFIRALSEEQVYFPPADQRQFKAATADLNFEVVPQLELMERYTRHFIACGYYNNLPSGPRTLGPNERQSAPRPTASGTPGAAGTSGLAHRLRGDVVDERLRFDPDRIGSSEAYYVLWTDPVRRLQMVVRYVLFNGPIEEAKVAEVWCWFRDRARPENDVALRQRVSIGRAELIDTDQERLRIGASGYGANRVWGEIITEDRTVRWDFALDHSDAVGVERVAGMGDHDLFPYFQSNGVRHRLSGTVEVNHTRYTVTNQIASDGHYWNTKHVKAWSWGHCAQFEGDREFLFEGIALRFNEWSQPYTCLTFIYQGEIYRSNLVDAMFYNRELDSDLTSWTFSAERGDVRFTGRLTARTQDQILIVHPLPDDEYLYTHITYTGDMTVDIERKEGGQWWKIDQRVARETASFEVTRKERNPEVRREFQIVRAR